MPKQPHNDDRQHLLERLQSSDPGERRAAATELGSLGRQSDLVPLAEARRLAEDDYTRRLARGGPRGCGSAPLLEWHDNVGPFAKAEALILFRLDTDGGRVALTDRHLHPELVGDHINWFQDRDAFGRVVDALQHWASTKRWHLLRKPLDTLHWMMENGAPPWQLRAAVALGAWSPLSEVNRIAEAHRCDEERARAYGVSVPGTRRVLGRRVVLVLAAVRGLHRGEVESMLATVLEALEQIADDRPLLHALYNVVAASAPSTIRQRLLAQLPSRQ